MSIPVRCIAGAIRHRADEVARDYLGFFEWVAWGVLRQAPVYILIGRELIDVFEVFAPALRPPPGHPGLVAAACIADGTGTHRPIKDHATLRAVNHWVQAVPLRSSHAKGELSLSDDPSTFCDLLSVESLRAGFGIRRTRSDGHCAVHVMANVEGRENTLATMLSIRQELAALLRNRADDPAWQNAYVTCEGYDPVENVRRPTASKRADKRMYMGSALSPHPPLPPPLGPPPATTQPVVPGQLEVHASACASAGASAPAASEGASADASACASADALACASAGASEHQKREAVPFVAWFGQQSEKKRRSALVDYSTLVMAQREWRCQRPPREARRPKVAEGRRIYEIRTVRARLLLGQAFLKWRASHGAASKNFLIDFLRYHRQDEHALIPKKDTVLLKRCIDLAKNAAKGSNVGEYGARLPGQCQRFRAPRLLKRQRGKQGRLKKCPSLSEALFDWFVDLRLKLSARVTPKLAMAQAKVIATDIVQYMRQQGIIQEVPVIDRHWMLRWQRDHRISFRKPNARHKCDYKTLKNNCSATWCDVYFARALAIECFGHDLPIFGLDQTPLQMNLGGAKDSQTLELIGAPEAPVRECHAQTRARISVLTCVASDPDTADQPGGLPIEIMFKGKTVRTLKEHAVDLVVPAESNIALGYSPKGSYREEHMYDFLDRFLPPFDEARRACHDWRMLLMDSYAAHMSDRIRELCWERGYVLLFHRGHITAVTQVNDTDLHMPFKLIYGGLECARFARKLTADPNDIGASRQEVNCGTFVSWYLS
jgi:hypothetical protein